MKRIFSMMAVGLLTTAANASTNEFLIISIAPNEQGQITFTWYSRPNDTFTIWYANELTDSTVWNIAEENYPAKAIQPHGLTWAGRIVPPHRRWL